MVFIDAPHSRHTDAHANRSGLTRRLRRYAQVLFADWTPTNLQPHAENVEVYSNCKEVELFLNGKSLGAKTINADASPRNWQVPLHAGSFEGSRAE